MARTIGKLTALRVTQERRPGYYSDGGGLYLQVGASGAKSWVFRFRQSGRLRDMGLGPLHTVSLAEARQRALAARRTRMDGRDPIAERRAQRAAASVAAAKAMTFRECAEAYVAAQEPSWRNAKHGAQWITTLRTYVYPVLGVLPVADIDTSLVMRVLEPIWSTKPETASRVRGRIESVLDWATARGHREGENPARWRGHLDKLLPAPSKAKRAARVAKGRAEHHAALPYDEIGAFMTALRAQRAWPPAPWSSPSLPPPVLARCWAPDGPKWTWPRGCGPFRPNA